jgi:hypothetical protein
MKTVLFFMMVVLPVATLSADGEFDEYFKPPGVKLSESFQTAHGFSVNVPPGWVRIPDDVLDEFEKNVASLMPNVKKQTYDYGFQLGPVDKWFTYPYILIHVNEAGRIPSGQLESAPRINRDLHKGLKRAETELKSMVSNIEMNKTYYDARRHILWTQIGANVAEVGPVRGLMAAVLTQRGVIQISSYATAAEFDRYAPLFEQISREISIIEELRYKPQAGDSPPPRSGIDWNRVMNKGMAGAVIGAIGGLLFWVFKKKTPDIPNTYNM